MLRVSRFFVGTLCGIAHDAVHDGVDVGLLESLVVCFSGSTLRELSRVLLPEIFEVGFVDIYIPGFFPVYIPGFVQSMLYCFRTLCFTVYAALLYCFCACKL